MDKLVNLLSKLAASGKAVVVLSCALAVIVGVAIYSYTKEERISAPFPRSTTTQSIASGRHEVTMVYEDGRERYGDIDISVEFDSDNDAAYLRYTTQDYDRSNWEGTPKDKLAICWRHLSINNTFSRILVVHPKHVSVSSVQRAFMVPTYHWLETQPLSSHMEGQVAQESMEVALDSAFKAIPLPFAGDVADAFLKRAEKRHEEWKREMALSIDEDYVATEIPAHLTAKLVGQTETGRDIKLTFHRTASSGSFPVFLFARIALGDPSYAAAGSPPNRYGTFEIDAPIRFDLRGDEEPDDRPAPAANRIAFNEIDWLWKGPHYSISEEFTTLICTCNFDGSSRRRLVNGSQPQWSAAEPNTLFFISSRFARISMAQNHNRQPGQWFSQQQDRWLSETESGQRLCSLNVRDESVMTISPGPVRHYDICPRGNLVAYIGRCASSKEECLVVAKLKRNGAKEVISLKSAGRFGLVRWSKDGKKLYVVATTERHSSDIFMVDLRTGKFHNITNTPLMNEIFFSVSQDGRIAVLGQTSDEGYTLGICAPGKHEVRVLVDGSNRLLCFFPQWSPDGKSLLAISAGRSLFGTWNFIRIDIASGKVELLRGEYGHPTARCRSVIHNCPAGFEVMPTGEILYFAVYGKHGYKIDQGVFHRLDVATRIDTPLWSPFRSYKLDADLLLEVPSASWFPVISKTYSFR